MGQKSSAIRISIDKDLSLDVIRERNITIGPPSFYQPARLNLRPKIDKVTMSHRFSMPFDAFLSLFKERQANRQYFYVPEVTVSCIPLLNRRAGWRTVKSTRTEVCGSSSTIIFELG